MSTGLGIALAGIWAMVSASLISKHVSTAGFFISLVVAIAATVYLA